MDTSNFFFAVFWLGFIFFYIPHLLFWVPWSFLKLLSPYMHNRMWKKSGANSEGLQITLWLLKGPCCDISCIKPQITTNSLCLAEIEQTERCAHLYRSRYHLARGSSHLPASIHSSMKAVLFSVGLLRNNFCSTNFIGFVLLSTSLVFNFLSDCRTP